MIEMALNATSIEGQTLYLCMKRKGDAFWKKISRIDGPHERKEGFALDVFL